MSFHVGGQAIVDGGRGRTSLQLGGHSISQPSMAQVRHQTQLRASLEAINAANAPNRS